MRPRRLDMRNPLGQFLKQHRNLQPGQPHAKADVRAKLPEGKVPVGAAHQVDPQGIVEMALVPVGRNEPV